MKKMLGGLILAASLLVAGSAFASVPSASIPANFHIDGMCYVEPMTEGQVLDITIADTPENLAALRAGGASYESNLVMFAYGSNFANAQLTADLTLAAADGQILPGTWSVKIDGAAYQAGMSATVGCTAPGNDNTSVQMKVDGLSLNDVHNTWTGEIALTIAEL